MILSRAGDSVSWLWIDVLDSLLKPSSEQRGLGTSTTLPVETDEDEPAMLGPTSTNDPPEDFPLMLSIVVTSGSSHCSAPSRWLSSEVPVPNVSRPQGRSISMSDLSSTEISRCTTSSFSSLLEPSSASSSWLSSELSVHNDCRSQGRSMSTTDVSLTEMFCCTTSSSSSSALGLLSAIILEFDLQSRHAERVFIGIE